MSESRRNPLGLPLLSVMSMGFSPVVLLLGKTESGKRVIPLNDDAWRAILELRERSEKLVDVRPSPDWYVFPHAEGSSKPDPTQPMRSWRTAWRRLTRAGWHSWTPLSRPTAPRNYRVSRISHERPNHHEHCRTRVPNDAGALFPCSLGRKAKCGGKFI